MKNMYCVEEYDSLYTSENLQNGDSDEGVDLSYLKTLYTDMQTAVKIAEDNNFLLKTENSALKKQITSSRQSIQNIQLLVQEVEDLKAAKAEKDQTRGKIESSRKDLGKENETLREKIVELSREVSSFLLERQQQDKEITKLSSVLRALEKQLEELKYDLEDKGELINQKDLIIEQLKDSMSEYITINQNMKEKLKDLEDQLALALVSGEGSFMKVDTEAIRENSVSLGEELGLITDKVIPEQKEDEEEEEEQATLYVSESKIMTHSCTGNIKRGAFYAVGLCFSIIGVFGALSPSLPTDVLDTSRHPFNPYCQTYTTGLPPV